MQLRLLAVIIIVNIGFSVIDAKGAISDSTTSFPFNNSVFVTIDGISVHYRILEMDVNLKGNIVFIHGFAASTFSWRKNMDYFAEKGYRVVAVDMPGYGYSEKRRSFDHSHESRSKLIWELLDSICKEKWILIGHSMGGGTAGYMAAMRPEHTEKLVMVDGIFGRLHQTLGRMIGSYLVRFPVLFHLIEGFGKSIYVNYERFESLLSSAYGEKADSCAVIGYMQPFKSEGSAVAVFETFMRGFDEKQPDLDKIDMPVLLLWGENDTWVPVELAHQLHPKLKNSYLKIINDAGHNPMETHADEFNEILLRFLANPNGVDKQ